MTRKHLSKIIRRVTGLTVPEFCTKYLNTNYKAFQYRARVKRLTPNEIILLSWVLGEPVEGLFGKQFLPLMYSQGEPEIEKQLVKMYQDADDIHKQRLLNLLGGKIIPEFKVITPTISPVTSQAIEVDDDELQDTEELPVMTPAFKKKSEPIDDSDLYVDVQVHR